MPSRTSARIGLAIGAAMIAIGIYIVARSLLVSAAPMTGQRWLDLAFAFFFVVRGGLQVQRWRRTMGRGAG